jgi:septal ring factor EnvC (AmiA/AmiB activator)
MRGRWLAAAVLLGLALARPLPAAPTDPAQLALRAAHALEQAQIALERAEGARDRVAALTRVIRAYEEGLMALREGLRRAAIREAELTRRFAAEGEKLSRLLGALMSIGGAEVPELLLHPAGPLATARAGMILGDVTPALKEQAEALRRELEELAILRELQARAADQLAQALAGVQEARARLSEAISNREELPRRFLADPQAVASLIASSETLAAFASGLAEIGGSAAEEGPVLPAFERMRGRTPLPVTGRILRRFGEADAAGIRRPGLVIATPPRALVTSPWPATIRYRGPLLDYGNVIILEPASGYLLVLAGLDEVYGEIGEVLEAGAPVGLMGGAAPAAEELLSQAPGGAGGELSETLYMELRKNNEPVDPEPWFTAG